LIILHEEVDIDQRRDPADEKETAFRGQPRGAGSGSEASINSMHGKVESITRQQLSARARLPSSQ
jgi:hypothetical protein